MPEFFSLRKRYHDRMISDAERASSLFPPVCYDENNHLFLGDDKTIGFAFVCTPLYGTSEKIEQQVNSLLNEAYPAGTQAQFLSFRSPDVVAEMDRMLAMRDGLANPLLKKMVRARSEYFTGHTLEKLVAETEKGTYNLGYLHDLKIIVSYKFQIAGNMATERETSDVLEIFTKVKTTLTDIHMRPASITATMWIRIMNTIFNWSESASWRNGNLMWDEKEELCNQVLDYDVDIEHCRDHVRIGSQYVKVLSAKRKPDHMYFGEAMKFCGDLSGGLGGVRQHYMVCVNAYFPAPDKAKSKIESKRTFAVNQADGPLVKFVPVLLDKKVDFDTLYESMNNGFNPVKVSYHVVVFGTNREEVDKNAMTARNFWRSNRFELLEDKLVSLPVFLNCLPLCADAEAIDDLNRHKTLTAKEASLLLPLFGEWKGTGTPHVNLISRNNQVMSFSLHDSDSNYNAVIAATSGSGKSFLTNEIVLSYRSDGALVWIIDKGKSYEKLCTELGGSFVAFGGESKVGLNPFPLVVSLDGTDATRVPGMQLTEFDRDDGEEDALIGLLSAMAAQKDGLDDFQVSQLKRVLYEQWTKHYRELTIDILAEACKSESDQRIKDIGHQLYPFTSQGAYGRYFNGPNTMSFDGSFTVLEIEELGSRKHLQKVILLQLIYQIQQEMYLGERKRKKLVIIDEAWDLLTEGDVAKFIEHGYRRFRKYGGSIIIVTQSIMDLYNSTTGRAIAENSATTLLLAQKNEALTEAISSGRLQLSAYEADQIRTVHTVHGAYSEIFVMSANYGRGIGRLVVSDFQKLLYSTNSNDVREIDEIRRRGVSVEDAINDVLWDRKQKMNLRKVRA